MNSGLCWKAGNCDLSLQEPEHKALTEDEVCIVGSIWDAPDDPQLLVFMPLCISLHWVWVGRRDLLPTMKMWKKWWEVTSGNRVKKNLSFFVLPLSGSLGWCSNCHVVSCPIKRPSFQGTEGILWPIACKHVNPTNNLESELGSGPLPIEPWDDCSPGRSLDYNLLRGPRK